VFSIAAYLGPSPYSFTYWHREIFMLANVMPATAHQSSLITCTVCWEKMPVMAVIFCQQTLLGELRVEGVEG
jgi:hypothetical protein